LAATVIKASAANRYRMQRHVTTYGYCTIERPLWQFWRWRVTSTRLHSSPRETWNAHPSCWELGAFRPKCYGNGVIPCKNFDTVR